MPGRDLQDLVAGCNEAQARAIAIDTDRAAPVLVLAGAGTGKTHVLTARIQFLVRSGVPARHLLALTFTRAAAEEMALRARAGLEKSGHSFAGLEVRTFHALAYSLLRGETGGRPNWARLGLTAVPSVVDDEVEVADAPTTASEAKGGREILHLSDLVPLAARLLKEHADVLEECRRHWTHILVDEYQDTSPDQLEILGLLGGATRRLFLVGDDDQAIYGFRGADTAGISRLFTDHPDLLVVKLEENYRSTARVLRYANTVFRHKPRALRKVLRAGAPPGRNPLFKAHPRIQAMVHASGEEEIEWMAGEMLRLKDPCGLGWKDFAVLYRLNAQTAPYQKALSGRLGPEAAGQIVYSTVHAAKGLQYPVVFLPGLEDGIFPYHERSKPATPERLAEEKRLYYVAVTRAEGALFLSACRRRTWHGRSRRFQPSPFLLDGGGLLLRCGVRLSSVAAAVRGV